MTATLLSRCSAAAASRLEDESRVRYQLSWAGQTRQAPRHLYAAAAAAPPRPLERLPRTRPRAWDGGRWTLSRECVHSLTAEWKNDCPASTATPPPLAYPGGDLPLANATRRAAADTRPRAARARGTRVSRLPTSRHADAAAYAARASCCGDLGARSRRAGVEPSRAGGESRPRSRRDDEPCARRPPFPPTHPRTSSRVATRRRHARTRAHSRARHDFTNTA